MKILSVGHFYTIVNTTGSLAKCHPPCHDWVAKIILGSGCSTTATVKRGYFDSHAQRLTTGSCNCENHTVNRHYGILKKLSWEVAALTWKLIGILYSERKTLPATFSPGEV